MIDMNKAIIFIFAALLTISCVGREETASEEKGDHVNTFIYSNDTLTIEPVNGDCMAPYPFGFQKPLADYRKDFSFLKENKTSDYQCIQNYYTFSSQDNQIILQEESYDDPFYTVIYANITDPRIVLKSGIHVGETRDSVLSKLHMKEEVPNFHVLIVGFYPTYGKTYFYFDKDTLCRIKILSIENVIQNPEPCGFIEAGRCRGWKGKKLFAAKGSEFLNPVCYLNEQGDTIVPYGKYEYCGFDSIAPIGIVAEPHVGIVMINSKGEKLFEVMTIDNFQADDICEGLYRILDDEGKIGYADTLGHVVIKPQFQCAWPFEGGRARVAYHGKKNSMDEHSEWESDEWFYIDKNGQRVDGPNGKCLTGIESLLVLPFLFIKHLLFPFI